MHIDQEQFLLSGNRNRSLIFIFLSVPEHGIFDWQSNLILCFQSSFRFFPGAQALIFYRRVSL